jgi:hypothetical protein
LSAMPADRRPAALLAVVPVFSTMHTPKPYAVPLDNGSFVEKIPRALRAILLTAWTWYIPTLGHFGAGGRCVVGYGRVDRLG